MWTDVCPWSEQRGSKKPIRSTLQQTENYLWDNLKRYDSKKNGEY